MGAGPGGGRIELRQPSQGPLSDTSSGRRGSGGRTRVRVDVMEAAQRQLKEVEVEVDVGSLQQQQHEYEYEYNYEHGTGPGPQGANPDSGLLERPSAEQEMKQKEEMAARRVQARQRGNLCRVQLSTQQQKQQKRPRVAELTAQHAEVMRAQQQWIARFEEQHGRVPEVADKRSNEEHMNRRKLLRQIEQELIEIDPAAAEELAAAAAAASAQRRTRARKKRSSSSSSMSIAEEP